MKHIISIAAVLAVAIALPTFEDENLDWDAFKIKFGKTYQSSEEEAARQKIFLDKVKKIKEHNEDYRNGRVTHWKGIDPFTDMTSEEFADAFLISPNVPKPTYNLSVHVPQYKVQLPEEVDWRKEGAVTDVKFQGYHCGSCYAFSATGALEGQIFRKTGQLVSLSEQNIVDCSTQYGNRGCHGGFPTSCFRYITDNGGIDTENSYPYEGHQDNCRYKPENSGAQIVSAMKIQEGDEQALQHAVATVGPISVSVHAQGDFDNYRSGILDHPFCKEKQLDHAVLVVGYGTENGRDYWIVKNSWGTHFGENGYIRLARGNNQCGITADASYPIV